MIDTKRKKHLRKFGFVMSIPLMLLAAFLFYKGRPAAPYLLAPGALLVVLALVAPALLDPIERGWMWFALRLQVVTTTIILSIAFYLIVTPIGLYMRLRGRDLLKLRKNDGGTYWQEPDREGSASRPTKPY